MVASHGGGGGFHQQVLGALHKSVSVGEKRRLPKQTRLGMVLDIFTGTAEELPPWLDKNRPSRFSSGDQALPALGDYVLLEVFPGFDTAQPLISTNAYGERAVQRFMEEAEAHRKKRGDVPDLKTLALKHRIFDGKWFCFFNCDVIDEVWGKVASAVVEGRLSSRRATVSLTTDDHGMHLLCLYVDDFRDVKGRTRLEEELRKLLDEPRMKMVFRPLFVSYYCSTLDDGSKAQVKRRFKDVWSQGVDRETQASKAASIALVTKRGKYGKRGKDETSKDLRSLALLSVYDKPGPPQCV